MADNVLDPDVIRTMYGVSKGIRNITTAQGSTWSDLVISQFLLWIYQSCFHQFFFTNIYQFCVGPFFHQLQGFFFLQFWGVKTIIKNIGEKKLVFTFKNVSGFLFLFQCMKSPVIKPPPFTSFFGRKRRKKRQAQKNNETDPFSGFEDLTDDDFFDEVGYGVSNYLLQN